MARGHPGGQVNADNTPTGGGRTRSGRKAGPREHRPKGVKADYDEYRAHKEVERRVKAAERSALIDRLVEVPRQTPRASFSAQQAQDKAATRCPYRRRRQRQDSDADDILDDEESEASNRRRAEMQQRSKPTFGKVTTLGARFEVGVPRARTRKCSLWCISTRTD